MKFSNLIFLEAEVWISNLSQNEVRKNDDVDKIFKFIIKIGMAVLGEEKLNELNKIEIECLKFQKKFNQMSNQLKESDWKILRIEEYNLKIFLKLFEYQNDSNFPRHLCGSEQLEKLYDALILISIFHNDLISVDKDEKMKEFGLNILSIRMKERNINLKESILSVITDIEKLELEIKGQLENLKKNYFTSDEFIKQIHKIYEGSLFWYLQSKRYF